MNPTPPSGELRLVDDVPSAFAELVAAEIADATAPVKSQGDGRFRLVLSGGETARACYERLAALGGIAWRSVDVFLGDERCVPPDDDAANQRLVRESLLATADGATFSPMDCSDPEGYAALLAAQPALDLIHLGLGPDGHTASLFPGSTALESPPGALVALNDDPSGRNPHRRLTLTFEGISRGRLVVFTVTGSDKHAALSAILAGEDLPAARVRAGRVLWLCDAGAFEG